MKKAVMFLSVISLFVLMAACGKKGTPMERLKALWEETIEKCKDYDVDDWLDFEKEKARIIIDFYAADPSLEDYVAFNNMNDDYFMKLGDCEYDLSAAGKASSYDDPHTVDVENEAFVDDDEAVKLYEEAQDAAESWREKHSAELESYYKEKRIEMDRQRALEFEKEGNLDDAYSVYKELEKMGDSTVWVKLYQYERDTNDPQGMCVWLEKLVNVPYSAEYAQQLGMNEQQFNDAQLGWYEELGKGYYSVDNRWRDVNKAVPVWEKGAELGSRGCMKCLSDYYHDMADDKKMADYWEKRMNE